MIKQDNYVLERIVLYNHDFPQFQNLTGGLLLIQIVYILISKCKMSSCVISSIQKKINF